jgi:hypothetical protein
MIFFLNVNLKSFVKILEKIAKFLKAQIWGKKTLTMYSTLHPYIYIKIVEKKS